MKKLIYFFTLMIFVACSKPIDTPKKLIPKETMSILIADFAINDQMPMINSSGNMEISTRYILNKYKLKGTDFVESYKYYIVTKEMDGILAQSQEIIEEKDPSGKEYIEKKIEKNKNLPSFAR